MKATRKTKKSNNNGWRILCAIAIEWMDEALDKINPRVTNPREILDNKMTNECHRHGMM